jgi:hypothetical protein
MVEYKRPALFIQRIIDIGWKERSDMFTPNVLAGGILPAH